MGDRFPGQTGRPPDSGVNNKHRYLPRVSTATAGRAEGGERERGRGDQREKGRVRGNGRKEGGEKKRRERGNGRRILI